MPVAGGTGQDPVADGDPIGAVLPGAALRLEQLDGDGVRVRERHLQEALAAMLSGGDLERRAAVPGWDPQPGGLDVLVCDEAGALTHVIETKLKADDRIFECLWDLAKVLSLSRGESTPAAYLVTGTTMSGWTRYAGTELFASGTHGLVAAIERYRDWWVRYVLGDSTGRPLEVPELVRVERIATVPLELNGQPWELRAVRVAAEGRWMPFADGLPARAPP